METFEYGAKSMNWRIQPVNKIISLSENIFNSDSSEIENTIILDLINSLFNCKKYLNLQISTNHSSKLNNYSIELKNFEILFFKLFLNSKFIISSLFLIYDNEFINVRNYYLENFYEFIQNKKNINKTDLFNIFSFLVENLKKEEKRENLQLIYKILTKIISEDKMNSDIYKSIKENSFVDELLKRVDYSEIKIKREMKFDLLNLNLSIIKSCSHLWSWS